MATLQDYKDFADQVGQIYGMPSGLLKWQMMQESSGNNSAQNPLSGSTSSGIMGFTNPTAQWLNVNKSDPYDQIQKAAQYDVNLFKQTGSWAGAMNAYGTTANNPTLQQQALNIINETPNNSSNPLYTHTFSGNGIAVSYTDNIPPGGGGQDSTSNSNATNETSGFGNNAQNSSESNYNLQNIMGSLEGLPGVLLFILGVVLIVLAFMNTDTGKQTINLALTKGGLK